LTQHQLDSAVAGITGETISTIHRLGFGLLGAQATTLEPEDLRLVLDCPFCGHPIPYPGQTRRGEPALAECAGCDVVFDYRPDEIYAAGPVDPGLTSTDLA
jgi:hypothetical protein